MPDAEEPELSNRVPDTPADPTFRVDKDMVPDPELTLEPACMTTLPPIPVNALPADRVMLPPPAAAVPEVVDPPTTNTDPTAVPELDTPTAIDMDPPRPDVA